MRYIGWANCRESPGAPFPPGGKTVDLPIAEAVETSGAYASNALFIAGSVLSSPVGLIGDLGSFLSSFLPRF